MFPVNAKHIFSTVLQCDPPPSFEKTSMSQPGQGSLGTNLTYTCDDGLGLPDRATQFYVTCEKPRDGLREWVKPNSTECLGTDYT